MNKIFLVLGVVGSLCVTDAFAARLASESKTDVVAKEWTCTERGCSLHVGYAIEGDTITVSYSCQRANGTECSNPVRPSSASSAAVRAAKVTKRVIKPDVYDDVILIEPEDIITEDFEEIEF